MDTLSEALNSLRNDLSLELGDQLLGCYLIGSTLRAPDRLNDIDTVVIVNDAISQFDFATRTAALLFRRSRISGSFISCFPIRKRDFDRNGTQFAANVKQFGLPF